MNAMQLGKDRFFLSIYEILLLFMKRFFGATGRGTEDHFGMIGKIDIINSTLGKALGGAAGGYTTGPKALIDLLRQRSRPYLFSNTLPPFVY
jgi:7-keto-8-aminopelargonate synthetase-like enzyme